MPNDLFDVIEQLLSVDSETRLFALEGEGEAGAVLGELHVENWFGTEAVNSCFRIVITCLSTTPDFWPDDFLNQRVRLLSYLSDGTRLGRSGLITAAAGPLENDGSLTRYRFVVEPWFAQLKYSRRPRSFQQQTALQIVESIFDEHRGIGASWQLAPEVASFMQDARIRPYTYQHNETDHDFIVRLLSEEGLNFRFAENEAAPLGHDLVIFANSADCPEDDCSETLLGGRGIRYHRASSQEEQDAIQVFGGHRTLNSAVSTALSWNANTKSSVTANVPTHHVFGGQNAPSLERYRPIAAGTYANAAQASRYTTFEREAAEARNKRWLGRATVRSFSAGTTFDLTNSSLDELGQIFGAEADRRFFLTDVQHIGINNLPKQLIEATSLNLDPASRWKDLDANGHEIDAPLDADVMKQANATGYGNAFSCLRASIPWRPVLIAKRTAPQLLTGLVIGPQGETSPSGADELYMNRDGCIRVKLFGQDGGGTLWVRVAQRYAGTGMGAQFIPRIGHEVAVGFIDDDIDQPIVIGSFYNGKGEGGVPATPGGKPGESKTDVFTVAKDHIPSAQGNLSGANSPLWHGASATASGHRNAAAVSGLRTKEFGGLHHGQLLFDDTDGQLAVQFSTSVAATQLNLGHLIHRADNYRGSLRGDGFELRTDSYGALRAARGLTLTTFGTNPAEPSQDNAPGIALAKQAAQQAKTFSQAATTHQTVAFATSIGSTNANASTLLPDQSPLAALQKITSGMVNHSTLDAALNDAANTNTSTGHDKVPHSSQPTISVVGKAGIGLAAGQDQHWAAGETISVQAGQDLNLGTGEQLRLHTGQAIGILGGAVKPGSDAKGTGITIIAGQGPVDIQAQADIMAIAAKNNVDLKSVTAEVNLASPKQIQFKVAGGASITLSNGQLLVSCPGNITVHAATKSFVGPGTVSTEMPKWPQSGTFDQAYVLSDNVNGEPLRNWPYEYTAASGKRVQAMTNDKGETELSQGAIVECLNLKILKKRRS